MYTNWEGKVSHSFNYASLYCQIWKSQKHKCYYVKIYDIGIQGVELILGSKVLCAFFKNLRSLPFLPSGVQISKQNMY